MVRNLITACCLTIARIALGMWVGSAVLFVTTSVAEQTASQFDSVIRDHLATIRFPHYYRFGAICLLISVASAGTAALTSHGRQRRQLLVVVLLATASATVATADYLIVYSPLQAEITPPGKPRSQRFLELHHQSRLINEVHLGIAATAAIVCCLPISDRALRSQPVS